MNKSKSFLVIRGYLLFITLLILGVALIRCRDVGPKQAVSISKLNVQVPQTDSVYIMQKGANFEIGQPHLKQLGTNFKSAQPDKDQLLRILKKHQIEVVARLNADSDKLSLEQEAKICKDQNIRFYYFNIEDDPHATYRQIRDFLQAGNTLVHCRHGYDRSGVILGLWLKENGATDQEVITFNQWENYLKKKGRRYKKYWDAVFEK